MKKGGIVKVCVNGKRPEDAIIRRFSFQRLVLVDLVNGGWKFVHETDIKEKAK